MSSKQQAINAASETLGLQKTKLRAQLNEATGISSVALVDGDGRVEPGALILVGPDDQVWTFSSNPGIHDPELVRSVVASIYSQGVAEHVEPPLLADRLQLVTAERLAQITEIVKDAEAGNLRSRPPRTLP